MSKARSEIDITDSLYVDLRVSLGIVHGSGKSLQHPACNTEALTHALEYVEQALERAIDSVKELDVLRMARHETKA